MPPAVSLEKKCVLVVEGHDELKFFDCLLAHLNIVDVQVFNAEGASKYSAAIRALPLTPGFTSNVQVVGVTKDIWPHATREAAMQSVQTALGQAGLAAPAAPLAFAGDSPKVGVLLVPPAADTGSLEDLCLQSVSEDPAMECVERFFGCLEEKAIDGPSNLPKAKMQVYLASRKDVNIHVGVAAEKGCFPLDHDSFAPVRKFLLDLAG
jgi:hypothetical protein